MVGESTSPLVIIAGGGTGGHTMPALAVAVALQKTPNRVTVLYVGKQHMDADLAAQAHVLLKGLDFMGCLGCGLGKTPWLGGSGL
ncbi:MAG: glycosyltransferase [Vampirovibrionales bacterium]